MKHLSSIFSFDTLQLKTLPWGRIAVFFLALLISVASLEAAMRAAAPHIRHFDMVNYPFQLGDTVFGVRQLTRDNPEIDFLVMGDSTIGMGVNAPLLKSLSQGQIQRSFNMGSGGLDAQRLGYFEEFVFDELGVKPKFVLIGMAVVVFNGHNPDLVEFDAKMREFGGIRSMMGDQSPIHKLALWQYRNAFRKMISTGGPYLEPSSTIMNNLGWYTFETSFDQWDKEGRGNFLQKFRDNMKLFTITPKVKTGTIHAMEAVRQRHIPAVVVLTPVYPSLLDTDDDLRRALAEIHTLLESEAKARNIPFYDLSKMPALHDEDFFDMIHLNTKGSEKFTGELIKQMQLDGLI